MTFKKKPKQEEVFFAYFYASFNLLAIMQELLLVFSQRFWVTQEKVCNHMRKLHSWVNSMVCCNVLYDWGTYQLWLGDANP